MKVLLLGPQRPHFSHRLQALGDPVVTHEDRLEADSSALHSVDFIVSYCYRFILKEDLLRRFPRRAINLHVSLLPWNRGSNPDLWSFLEDTPKGVSIHYIDAGIDTGPLLGQRQVELSEKDTLRISRAKLDAAVEALFFELWPEIREGRRASYPQPEGGSCHRSEDRQPYEHLLVRGWDTPVSKLIGKAKAGRGR